MPRPLERLRDTLEKNLSTRRNLVMVRTYSELSTLKTMEERFEYLRIGGVIGESTFGLERFVNQSFYKSLEWRQIRDYVLARDLGNDMGLPDLPVRGNYYIHHMNPLTMDDFEMGSSNLLDPEGLITCGLVSHNAIHFGDISLLPKPYVERRPGDTRDW
jgi:hypothetical protein